MDEVQKTINEIIRTHGEIIESLKAERDELIERLDRAKAERDEARRYMGETRDLYAADLIVRLKSCRMALDDMTAHAEEFKAEVRRMKEERDEAREVSRFYRDLYVSQVGRTYSEEYRLPWEAKE